MKKPDDDDDDNVLVCMRLSVPLLLPDNLVGHCRQCHLMVQFRPDAPKWSRMCVECVKPHIEAGAEVYATPETLAEVAEYLRKKGLQ